MGRVNQYQQDRLASSMVGTAGVDNSGTILAHAMGSATSQLAGTQIAQQARNNNINRAMTAAAFQSVGDEIMQKKVWQQQAAVQIKNKQDANAVNHYSMLVDDIMHAHSQEQQGTFKANPYKAREAFDTSWPEKYRQFVKDNPALQDKDVLDGVNKYVDDRLTIEHRTLTDFGFTQGNVNSKVRNKSNMETLGDRGGATGGDITKLRDVLDAIERQRPYLFDTEGSNTENVMRNAQNKAIKAHVQTLNNADPQAALKFLTRVEDSQKQNIEANETNKAAHEATQQKLPEEQRVPYEPRHDMTALSALGPDDIKQLRSDAEIKIRKTAEEKEQADAQALLGPRAELQKIKSVLVDANVPPDSVAAITANDRAEAIIKSLQALPKTKQTESAIEYALSIKSTATSTRKQAEANAAQLEVARRAAAAQEKSATAAVEAGRRQQLSDADSAVTHADTLKRTAERASFGAKPAVDSRVRIQTDLNLIRNAVTTDDGTKKVAVQPKVILEAQQRLDDALSKNQIGKSQYENTMGFYHAVNQWQSGGKQSGLRELLMGKGKNAEPPPAKVYESAGVADAGARAQVDEIYHNYLNQYLSQWEKRKKPGDVLSGQQLEVFRQHAAANAGRPIKGE